MSLAAMLSVWPATVAKGQTGFVRDVRPILARHCLTCHGNDEASREADLRLDGFDSATRDLGGYAAIVPGDADASELIARVTSTDDPMPPAGHAPLNESEVATLRKWINDGARYELHWAFVPPSPPAVPDLKDEPWVRGSIDAFVMAALKDRGLPPNGAEEPARLIRRLALDLTGLPPTAAQVESFVADQSNERYEAIVDELLADAAFGEHWASMWLDLARYADSVGYAGDEPRTIWPWRDWVIRAFNDNMPWDQFTIEQLAGDLLDEPTADQILATAFHRNTLSNNEGGTSDEEFRTVAVKDRLSTTGSTWLGLTVRCAECHSHKFDPVSHTAYYQLFDFFNQTEDRDLPDESPTLPLDGALVAGGEPVSVPVLRELPAEQHRTTHVMTRGNFRNPGEAVEAGVPAFLHALPANAPANRLGLAQWLVADDNPLTARVTVNRFWSRLFGRGLVMTEEDFGSQGSLPSHAELLDWLAVDFLENGWDVKRLLRQMVLSSAYRQSAVASEAKLAADRDNVWLARGPRRRLTAEMLRDQALAISGLLSRKMYGPPVFPPNPIRSVTNAFKGEELWTVSEGEDRYRRAIYTRIKRSQPHPLFETFDMATRDVCSLRRIATNTPLQSFVTLNDEAFVEAAQGMAARMLAAADNLSGQLAAGWRMALLRDATDRELEPLQSLYETAFAEYVDDLEAARLMAGQSGEDKNDDEIRQLAALTVVSNTILNLDAVLTR